MTSLARLIAPLLVLMLLGSYSCKEPVSRSGDTLRVLTTIAPLYCFTINVAGDAARVENLLPSGVGPHEFSLSPGDVKRIAQAQVIIKNGVNLETWLGKALKISGFHDRGSGNIVVDTSQGVDIIDTNPHIWLSPKNAMAQVRTIRDALIRVDPENRTTYENNASTYITRLEGLDREIRDEVQRWARREIVSYHSAFIYFFRDYGLVQAAVIQETHEIEPSPKHIAEVVDIIQARKINAIFTDPVISHKIVNSLADDLNLQIYRLDTLETGLPGPEWYIDTMRRNMDVLRKALNREA